MVNSVWFRLAGGLDIETWADPDDEEFFGRMSEPGLRQFSTNHLCGKGYWMWMIPLSSGPISIGIVADASFHAWDEMNTLDKAIDWIRGHEPQLGETIDARRDQVEDFLKVQDFSYGAKQVFSGEDRWCLVGEAGAFLDPFYSPGSDFIAFANTFAADLVSRELDGEDVVRACASAQRLLPERLPRAPHPVRGPVRVLGQPGGHEREDQREQHLLLGLPGRCCSSTASSPTSR